MTEEAAPAKEAEAPKAEAAPEAEPVQLIYLSRDSASTTEKVRIFFDRYEAETENVTVELQNLPSVNEALTKLKVAAAAGVPIDFLRCSWGSYLDLAEADVLQPLDDFFKRDGLVTTEVFLPATLTQWLDKGVLWGMPASGNCDALLINKQLLDVAGLERPPIDPSDASWTMDKFPRLRPGDDAGHRAIRAHRWGFRVQRFRYRYRHVLRPFLLERGREARQHGPS